MREILFRGKPIAEFLEIESINPNCFIYGDLEQCRHSDRTWINIEYLGGIRVAKETIGQYTGLTDKNGNKIFDGDIVKTREYDFGYVVKYGEFVPTELKMFLEDSAKKGMYEFKKGDEAKVYGLYVECLKTGECLLPGYHRKMQMWVIGNIHDNPDGGE